MTQAQAAALAKMHAANAALTPEQRKARSVAAAAASKAKGGTKQPPSSTPAKADAEPMPNRVWRVTFAVEHEGKRSLWSTEGVSAPTIKRAVREARAVRASLQRPGIIVAVASVVDRDLVKLPAEQV